MQFRIASHPKDTLNVEKFLFPNGLPNSINQDKVTAHPSPFNKDRVYYNLDPISVDKIIAHLATLKKKTEKDQFVRYMAFLFFRNGLDDEKNYPLFTAYLDHGDKSYELSVLDSRLSVSDIFTIFGQDYKFPKSFLKSVIDNLTISETDKPALMKMMENNRIEIHRILSSEVQFTKEELMRIIKFNSFASKTHSGTFANMERLDIVNRRSLIFYQDSVDSEIFMEVLNDIEGGDTQGKDSLLKLLKRNNVKEKFKNSPEVLLLAKLSQ
jgi:hypothetical protein